MYPKSARRPPAPLPKQGHAGGKTPKVRTALREQGQHQRAAVAVRSGAVGRRAGYDKEKQEPHNDVGKERQNDEACLSLLC